MALGPLSLNVTSGLVGKQFFATISGQTSGSTVDVVAGGPDAGTPGFGVINGRVYHSGLPYDVNTLVLIETKPGETPRYSRIDILADDRDIGPVYLASLGVATGVLTPEQFGAIGNNVADDTAALQAAFDAANSTRKKLIFQREKTYKFSSQLVLTLPLDIEFNHARFYPSPALATAGGYAVKVTGAMGTAQHNLSCTLANFWLNGPRDQAKNLDGVDFGGGATANEVNASNIDMPGWIIDGFRDNLHFSGNTYCLRFWGLVNNQYWRDGISFDCKPNAGENIAFHGGTFSNGRNAGGTARAVYSSTENPFLNVVFNATSFDYGDIVFDINAGAFDFNSCHFENGSNKVMGFVAYTSSKPHPAVRLNGGDIAFGTGGFNRAVLFDITGAAQLEFNGIALDNADNAASTTLVSVHGNPLKLVTNFNTQFGTGLGMPFVATTTNKLFNFGFGSAISNGWTSSLQAGSAIDSTNTFTFNSQTYNAFSFVLHASNAQYIRQRVVVEPGGTLGVRAVIAAASMSSGSGSITVQYYAQDGTTAVGSKITIGSAITANQSYTAMGDLTQRVPQGAAFAEIAFEVTAGSGTVRFTLPAAWKL